MEYLYFWVTHYGIKPTNKKIKAIKNMKPSTSPKKVRKVLGLLNYYRGMWARRSHMLAPWTKITSNKVKLKWTKNETDGFDEIKPIVAQDTLLAYPDFNEEFKIHTNASNFQSLEVINQKGKQVPWLSTTATFWSLIFARYYGTIEYLMPRANGTEYGRGDNREGNRVRNVRGRPMGTETDR